MTFNLAEFEAVIAKLEAGKTELSRLLAALPGATSDAVNHWYVPNHVKRQVTEASSQLSVMGNDLLDTLMDFLKGAGAPIRFFFLAGDWDDVRGLATTVGGNLNPGALQVQGFWSGFAANTYKAVIPLQSAAANRLGAVADKTQVALTWSAAAGAAFYAGVIVVLIQFLIAFYGVLAILGTVVFSWAGVALAVGEAGIGFGELAALSALLVAAITMQGIQLSNLRAEASDTSTFPGGHWPDGQPERYSDATVTDGDAEWSLQHS